MPPVISPSALIFWAARRLRLRCAMPPLPLPADSRKGTTALEFSGAGGSARESGGMSALHWSRPDSDVRFV